MSIQNLQQGKVPPIISSPRSVLAMKRLGLEQSILKYIPFQQFVANHPGDPDTAKLLFDQHEAKQLTIITELRQERNRVDGGITPEEYELMGRHPHLSALVKKEQLTQLEGRLKHATNLRFTKQHKTSELYTKWKPHSDFVAEQTSKQSESLFASITSRYERTAQTLQQVRAQQQEKLQELSAIKREAIQKVLASAEQRRIDATVPLERVTEPIERAEERRRQLEERRIQTFQSKVQQVGETLQQMRERKLAEEKLWVAERAEFMLRKEELAKSQIAAQEEKVQKQLQHLKEEELRRGQVVDRSRELNEQFNEERSASVRQKLEAEADKLNTTMDNKRSAQEQFAEAKHRDIQQKLEKAQQIKGEQIVEQKEIALRQIEKVDRSVKAVVEHQREYVNQKIQRSFRYQNQILKTKLDHGRQDWQRQITAQRLQFPE